MTYHWTKPVSGRLDRDIPIIFSGPMVNSLNADRKIMTRRLLYSSRMVREGSNAHMNSTAMEGIPPPKNEFFMTRYFTLSGWERVRPGDRLWVRENLRFFSTGHDCEITYCDDLRFQAGPISGDIPDESLTSYFRFADKAKVADGHTISIPSIHCPRWASRLTLIVTEVKIEKLLDITEADSIAEGIEPVIYHGEPLWRRYAPEPITKVLQSEEFLAKEGLTNYPRTSFLSLWASLHGFNGGYETVRFNPAVVAIGFRVIKANIDSPEAVA